MITVNPMITVNQVSITHTGNIQLSIYKILEMDCGPCWICFGHVVFRLCGRPSYTWDNVLGAASGDRQSTNLCLGG